LYSEISVWKSRYEKMAEGGASDELAQKMKADLERETSLKLEYELTNQALQAQIETWKQRQNQPQNIVELQSENDGLKDQIIKLETLNDEFIENMHLEKKAKDKVESYYREREDEAIIKFILLGGEVERLHNILDVEYGRSEEEFTQ
jgi:hypothetical protein